MRTPHEWQPIETAPKDGRNVVVWIPELHRAMVITWHTAERCWWEIGRGSLGLEPTHWMPLPDPPVGDQP